MPHTPPTAVEIAQYTEHSTRAEIEEALGHCNASAKRCLRKDGLGRPNTEWAMRHRNMNYLLDMWQRTRRTPLAQSGIVETGGRT
jgi:hypothetical protein